ncbi:MAG: hypothetical protein ABSH20_20795, partial [Tepidisphaeraceae bacterium]
TKTARPQTTRPRWRRWLLRIVAATIVLALLLFWLGPIAARPMVRGKLQAMVSSQLNAELRIGRLRYSFPYGVDVTDVGLLAKDDDGKPVELLTIPRLEIGLAKLPFGPGPLVVSKLKLHEPVVHVIRASTGFVGHQTLAKGATTGPTGGPKRSEMFELRLVEVIEGRIAYKDRTLTGTVATVWQHIGLKMTTDPKKNPLYDFTLTLQSGSVGTATAAGTFHIDDLYLTAREFAATLTIDADATRSPAPPEIQRLLQQYEVRGTIKLSGKGRFCPETAGSSSFDADISLSNCHLRPAPGLPALENAAIVLQLWTDEHPGVLNLSVTSAQAAMGPAQLVSATARMSADLRATTWAVPQLSAVLHLTGEAEGDVRIRLDGSGVAVPQPDGRLNLRADAKRLLLLNQKILLADASLDAIITPDKIETVIDGASKLGLHASLFGGTVRGSASVLPRSAMQYEVPVEIAGVDLLQLSQHLATHGGSNFNLTGNASLSMKVQGSVPQGIGSLLPELGGGGRFEINNARLYELKSITAIIDTLHLGDKAGQFRQAAGIFTIAQQKINFSQLAASSSSLGLQGFGTVGFDGQLDIRLMAALLDDWRGKLKKSGIPLIGDVLGELAGGMQKLINTASGSLLSQFHVHGTLGAPQVTPEPAPLLTDQGAKLFGKMIQGTEKLLE